MRWQARFVTLASSLLISALLLLRQFDAIDGLGIDALFWLRSKAFGERQRPENSPTVVIAIDEETYRQQPFRDTPLALWTPYLGKLLNALLDANVRVIGFDVIFSTSAHRFLPQHDREFLLAQRRAASEGRLVLSKIQHSDKPITPFPGFGFAAGGGKNIRAANLFTDGDDIVRRVPLVLHGIGPNGEPQVENGFALELASRALGAKVTVSGDSLQLGSSVVPGRMERGALVNFDSGYPIPTFSLADIFNCVEQGNHKFISQHFGNKVVLLGAVLDVEDRKLSSRRFIVEPEGSYHTAQCVPSTAARKTQGFLRRSIPGVYIHAQAINDFLSSESLRPIGAAASGSVFFIAAAAAGFAALIFTPIRLILMIAFGSAAWAAISTIVFNRGIVLPLLDPIVAAVLAAMLLISYRFIITDRSKRQLRRAFGLYLAGNVIDRMLETEAPPALGGEEREITVMFSDLEGFTRASEQKTAQEVVNHLNRYFDIMVETIEAHGGYVDKFVGDGLLALFGAPLSRADHASAALEAARDCQKRLKALAEGAEFRTRIGLHSGRAVVGNIGSARRFNYTAVGDTVNLAARLESANKSFGTSVLFSEATWSHAGDPAFARKIGRIRVAGREEPLVVYSLPPDDANARLIQRFGQALELAELRKFADARAIFEEIAQADPAAALWAERLGAFSKRSSAGELVLELQK